MEKVTILFQYFPPKTAQRRVKLFQEQQPLRLQSHIHYGNLHLRVVK